MISPKWNFKFQPKKYSPYNRNNKLKLDKKSLISKWIKTPLSTNRLKMIIKWHISNKNKWY